MGSEALSLHVRTALPQAGAKKAKMRGFACLPDRLRSAYLNPTAQDGSVTTSAESEPQELPTTTFSDLGLHPGVLEAVNGLGYEAPTPIQARTIPPMLEGRDVLGQAQTGTGKTAAFALPLLSRIEAGGPGPQALILAPTRELAIQVSEALRAYAKHIDGMSVLPVYGGSGYGPQLRALGRGVQVVVGTPGRVMDHMRRGSLSLEHLRALVLDEADEMLRMGFIEDVTWVLEQSPPGRQVALFSATMPNVIRTIASEHLQDPVEVRIEQKAASASTVRQRVRVVPHHHKLDVLTRVLETEEYDAMIVFARTRLGATDLTDKLRARGVAAEVLSGAVAQNRREQIVGQLKSGRIDVLVATDVAARGLDVDRLSHVINFDAPSGLEAYVHRIGRTGRAGREGEAILFVTPRERHIIRSIERANRAPMERLLLPTTSEVNARRLTRFKAQIEGTLGSELAEPFRAIVRELVEEGADPVDVAAAIAAIGQGDEPLLLDAPPQWEKDAVAWRERSQKRDGKGGKKKGRANDEQGHQAGGPPQGHHGNRSEAKGSRDGVKRERFRVSVGASHGVRPGHIVGVIAGETGLEGRMIGRITIERHCAYVDLPTGMPKRMYEHLKTVSVCGQRLEIERLDVVVDESTHRPRPKKHFRRFKNKRRK